MHTIETFSALKADEMRAHLAERGIKVAAKATKAAMVEAFRAATTSAGQVESPEPLKAVVSDEYKRFEFACAVNDLVAEQPSNDPTATLKAEPIDFVCENQLFPSTKPKPAPAPLTMNRHMRRRAEALAREKAKMIARGKRAGEAAREST